jgi:DNA-binding response OmpR family regulator
MELLMTAGYTNVDSVASGEEALEIVGQVPGPLLLLMDIGLSGTIDGIETARRVRKKSDVPVIFITANTSDRTSSRIRGISRVDYLVKPFLTHDLLVAVRKALALGKNER